jgi:hypothetical protein
VPSTIWSENFDALTPPALPSNWTFDSSSSWATSTTQAQTSPNALKYSDTSGTANGAYRPVADSNAGSVQFSAYLYFTSAAGATNYIVFARKRDTNTYSTSNHYEVRVSPLNASIQLNRRSPGTTTLGSVTANSTALPPNTWLRVWVICNGTTISCQVQNVGTDQWLYNNSGAAAWASTQSTLLSATDSTITGTGYGGLYLQQGSGGTAYVDGALYESLASSPVAISPTAIPANHPGNITLTLTGTGTSWASGSTTFTVSGVSGVTKVSQSISSATSATLVVTTGSGTGTLTVSDGTNSNTVTVGAAALSLSPNSGLTNGSQTVTATGVNAVWTQETASTLFSLSGGTGASLSSVSVSSNTSATFSLANGSAAATLTVTDTPTGEAAAFTVNTGPVTVPITNTNLFFSPGSWDSDGTGALQANNVRSGATMAQTTTPGAYLLAAFTTTAVGNVALSVDVSPLSGDSAGNYPTIVSSVDNASWSAATQLATGQTSVTLATNLAAGSHTVRVALMRLGSTNRWNSATTPWQVFRVTGLVLPAGPTVSAPTLYPGTMVVFGDSETEGITNIGPPSSTTSDSTQNYVWMLAQALGCEFGQLGHGSTGWSVSNGAGVPTAPTAWNNSYSGRPRQFPAGLSYAFFDWGVADATGGGSDVAVTANIPTVLAAARAALPGTRFFVCVPVGRQKASAITAGFNNYQASNPDPSCYLIDFGSASNITAGFGATSATSGTGTLKTNDAIHYTVTAHGEVAARMAGAVNKVLAAGSSRARVVGGV